MLEEEDWLMRPVFRGLIKYESLLDGTLTIDDLLILNEGLAVQAENDRRLEAWRKSQ